MDEPRTVAIGWDWDVMTLWDPQKASWAVGILVRIPGEKELSLSLDPDESESLARGLIEASKRARTAPPHSIGRAQ